MIYLINELREIDKSKWIDLLSKIAHVGVENIALLNSVSGELTSANNNTFLIDEKILSQIQVLDKYSEEQEGTPAVRIIGEVISATKVIEKARNIFEEDIFSAFLSNTLVCGSNEYISAILRMNSEFYPIYLFLNLAEINQNKRADSISLIVARTKNKSKVLARVLNDTKLENKKNAYPLTSLKWGHVRSGYYQALINGIAIEVKTEEECKAALECLFHLEKDSFDVDFVKSQLLNMFRDFYPFKKDGINQVFRWALAYLDNLAYK